MKSHQYDSGDSPVSAPTDIEPMIGFFDLLSESLPPTELIHTVLAALVRQLDLSYAAYYRGSGLMAGQIFTEESEVFEGEPPLPLDALVALAARSSAAYEALEAGDSTRWTSKRSNSGIKLEIATDDSVFVLARRGPSLFTVDESPQISALIRILAKVIQTALRFAAVEERLVEDSLTGLYNRRYFEEALHREMERARRTGSSFSVVLLDLDDFKAYNDTYGHRDGDRLLGAAGAALGECVRKIDLATRYGGDEFALILPHTPKDRLPVLLTRLADDMQVALWRADVTRSVGVSMGASTFPEDGATADALVEAADKELYSQKGAKKSGLRLLRNVSEISDEAVQTAAEEVPEQRIERGGYGEKWQ